MVPDSNFLVGPTWGPPGSYRPQVGPMLAQWSLLSGVRSQLCPGESREFGSGDGVSCPALYISLRLILTYEILFADIAFLSKNECYVLGNATS